MHTAVRPLSSGEENSLREIKWTIWRGKGNDNYMNDHEKSDIFRNADIVLATPDKWAYPNGRNSNCDSYVATFEERLHFVKNHAHIRHMYCAHPEALKS